MTCRHCYLAASLLQYWIGGAAQTAKISAVFAQLTVNGKWEGPHVFMVRLRDDQGRITPGVVDVLWGTRSGLILPWLIIGDGYCACSWGCG